MIAPRDCPSVREWLARYGPGMPKLTEDIKEWLRPLVQPVASGSDPNESIALPETEIALPEQRDGRSA